MDKLSQVASLQFEISDAKILNDKKALECVKLEQRIEEILGKNEREK